MYTGRFASRNSSTSHARLYGTSSDSCSSAVSRTSSADEETQRLRAQLVVRVEEGALREARGRRGEQRVDPLARERRDRVRLRVLLEQRRTLPGADRVDLVQRDEDRRGGRALQARALDERRHARLGRVDHVDDHVRVADGLERDGAHRRLQLVLGLEQARGVEHHHLDVASLRIPTMRLRVDCGLALVMASLVPTT
jgi:hypothetical protein